MATAKTVRIHQYGGPEVMQLEDVELAPPAANEIQVRHTAIGLNFIDTYQRSGLYPLPLPSGLGCEACGVITAVGSDVTGLEVGDRISYGTGVAVAYAEANNIEAARVVRVPDTVDDETAAAITLKGMTAHFLLHDSYAVKPGQTVLVHAAAGGVGSLLCQWAKALGATVIGTVGSPEKAEQAKANGCHHTILYKEEDFVERVRDLTDGAGVPVVYDSVGKSTILGSFKCLQRFGMVVSFGQSSGAIPPIDIRVLAEGSFYLNRPVLYHHTASAERVRRRAAVLFERLTKGDLNIHINQRYSLADIAKAHEDLQARRTQGASVIIP